MKELSAQLREVQVSALTTCARREVHDNPETSSKPQMARSAVPAREIGSNARPLTLLPCAPQAKLTEKTNELDAAKVRTTRFARILVHAPLRTTEPEVSVQQPYYLNRDRHSSWRTFSLTSFSPCALFFSRQARNKLMEEHIESIGADREDIVKVNLKVILWAVIFVVAVLCAVGGAAFHHEPAGSLREHSYSAGAGTERATEHAPSRTARADSSRIFSVGKII